MVVRGPWWWWASKNHKLPAALYLYTPMTAAHTARTHKGKVATQKRQATAAEPPAGEERDYASSTCTSNVATLHQRHDTRSHEEPQSRPCKIKIKIK